MRQVFLKSILATTWLLSIKFAFTTLNAIGICSHSVIDGSSRKWQDSCLSYLLLIIRRLYPISIALICNYRWSFGDEFAFKLDGFGQHDKWSRLHTTDGQNVKMAHLLVYRKLYYRFTTSFFPLKLTSRASLQ